MQRVQAALKAQLSRQNEKMEIELKEKVWSCIIMGTCACNYSLEDAMKLKFCSSREALSDGILFCRK